jgi:uncharacterized protein (DUF58 family)
MKRPHEPHHSVLSPGLSQTPGNLPSEKRHQKKQHLSNKFDGVHITTDELYRLHGDALRLTATPADAVTSLFPGAYKAIFHGRGLEFDEVRAYQWGDDYRSIDWRVSARSGQLHTKLFHEERERTLYLLLDSSPSMHFGSRVQFKQVLAARIAAVFGWLAYENGDRMGGLVVGDSSRCRFQPSGMGETALIRVFKLFSKPAETFNQPPSRLLDGLLQLRRIVKKNALILLLSDFQDVDNETLRHLAHLSRHHDLAAIKIYDRLEAELPDHGYYPLTNGEQVKFIDGRQKTFRQAYLKRFNDQEQALSSHCKKYAITWMSLRTDEPLIEGLRKAIRSGFASASVYSRKQGNE